MKKLLKEIQEWKFGWKQYLKYSYKLTLFLYIARFRKLKNLFKKHFDIFLRTLFLSVGLIVGLVVIFLGDGIFTQDILSNYFIAVGAMSGGAMAIVFTISIFLIQSAADLYSSQYFEIYIHDWKEKIVYIFVIIITLLFFGFGLYLGGLEILDPIMIQVSIVASLILIGLVFALIDWQYKTVREKINPTKAISFLESQGLYFLDKIVKKDAKRISDIMLARDLNINENEALAKTYNFALQSYINDINRQLENLVEISLKLSDRQEVETTKRGLSAVNNVLIKYLELRKNSSVATPSARVLMAIESDSQRFLFDNLDRLNKAGEKFMKEDKDVLATHILNIYRSLAEKSKDITYVGRNYDNPILEHIVGNLESYIQIGMRMKNLEVVFQGAEKLGDVANFVAEAGIDHTLQGILDNLRKIAFYGIVEKQTIVVDQCNINIIKILYITLQNDRTMSEHHFSSGLKNIASISLEMFKFINAGYIQNDFTSSFALTKGYDQLYELFWWAYTLYNQTEDPEKKIKYLDEIIQLSDDLYRSLRTLSENLKHCDNFLVESVSRLIFNVNNIIVQLIKDDGSKEKRDELQKQLAWNVHLPYWFVHHSEKFDAGSNKIRSLIESVAKTGVLAINDLDNKELTEDAINCIGSITQEALNKNTDSYGYDEPRIIKRACYLGIIALKKGWIDVFAELYVHIINFEDKYKNKYFSNIPAHINIENISPKKDQLCLEIMRWRDEFDYNRLNRMAGLMDNTESLMYQLIDVEDIDWFTFKVWGKWDADSPINEKIENEIAKINKKRAIKKVVNCLLQIKNKKENE